MIQGVVVCMHDCELYIQYIIFLYIGYVGIYREEYT